jgi:hypothetical protein
MGPDMLSNVSHEGENAIESVTTTPRQDGWIIGGKYTDR